jgi:hypothetical protein
MTLAGFGATVAVAAAPAGASSTEMTAVGSFTTFFMMHALFPEVNMINPIPESGTLSQSIAADAQTCNGGLTYSVASGVQPPNGSGQGKAYLATEEGLATTSQGCVDFSRSSSPPAPHAETLPSTSTETGDPSPSHLDYYAYALDGVAPLVGSDAPSSVTTAGSNVGPNNGLTLAQVQAIYECVDTNWDQVIVNGVAGSNSPIVLFWPQAGSGTRAVYTDVLGFDPTKLISPEVCSAQPIQSFTANSITAPNEENTEDGIIYQNSVGATAQAGSVAAGSVTAAAMYIYSAGKFSSQWNDPTDYKSTADNLTDQTLNSGATNTMGNFEASTLVMATMQNTSSVGEGYVDLTPPTTCRFNQDTCRGTLAVDGNTVAEANEWYSNLPSTTGGNPSDSNASIPGVRYVYNIADTVLPSYNGAKDLIGFDNQTNGSKSVLCNGDMASTITAQGFLPLTTGSGAPTGSDAAGATCREFAGLSFPSQGTPIHWTTPVFDGRAR